jgi:hypothetical protein
MQALDGCWLAQHQPSILLVGWLIACWEDVLLAFTSV